MVKSCVDRYWDVIVVTNYAQTLSQNIEIKNLYFLN